jgi:hypothetical protein
MLSCDRALAGLDGRPLGVLKGQSRSFLAQVPHAAAWAARFTSAAPASVTSAKRLRQQAAPGIVRTAAQGIAQACVPILTGCSVPCWSRRLTPSRRGRIRIRTTLDPAVWAAACRRTGGFPIAEATRPDGLARR